MYQGTLDYMITTNTTANEKADIDAGFATDVIIVMWPRLQLHLRWSDTGIYSD